MRIRTTKPEFWRSDDIDRLLIEDRLLFLGLWNYVDDDGRGVDKPSSIAADLFAGDLERDPEGTSVRVHGGLKRLHAAGLIDRYEVDGRRYLAVVTFGKHQRINRPTPSRLPAPTSGNPIPPDPSVKPHAHLSEDSLHAREGTGEQGNRGTGEFQGQPRNSATDRARERLGPAHTIRAHRLVETYSETCARLPPAKLRSQLAAEVDGLIDVGWTDEEITAAIDLWATKALGPGALGSVAHELANRRPTATATQSTADQRVADAQALKAQLLRAPLTALPGGA